MDVERKWWNGMAGYFEFDGQNHFDEISAKE